MLHLLRRAAKPAAKAPQEEVRQIRWHIKKQAARPATAATVKASASASRSSAARRPSPATSSCASAAPSGIPAPTSASARIIPCLRSPTAKSRSETASWAASTCILCRRRRKRQIGTVRTGPFPQGGGPDEILNRIKTNKGEGGAPERVAPFFLSFSRNCHARPLSGARDEEIGDDVRKNAKIAAEAGISRGCAGACRGHRRRRRSSVISARAPWPYRMRDAEAFLAAPRDPVLPVAC